MPFSCSFSLHLSVGLSCWSISVLCSECKAARPRLCQGVTALFLYLFLMFCFKFKEQQKKFKNLFFAYWFTGQFVSLLLRSFTFHPRVNEKGRKRMAEGVTIFSVIFPRESFRFVMRRILSQMKQVSQNTRSLLRVSAPISVKRWIFLKVFSVFDNRRIFCSE